MSAHSATVVEPYEFPVHTPIDPPPWTGVASLNEENCCQTPDSAAKTALTADASERPQQETEQNIAERFEEGRRLGFEEGCRAERDSQNAQFHAEGAQHRDQLAGLIGRFETAMDRYLQEAEHEVVELALAVAARILRRESQMDPLLLTGAVRVAIGQLAASTSVRLLVPSPDAELWKEAIAHLPHLAQRPEVMADDNLGAGDCRIETEIGSVDLGLRSQLGEIERGFFDRVHVPGATRHFPTEKSEGHPETER